MYSLFCWLISCLVMWLCLIMWLFLLMIVVLMLSWLMVFVYSVCLVLRMLSVVCSLIVCCRCGSSVVICVCLVVLKLWLLCGWFMKNVYLMLCLLCRFVLRM